MGRRSRRAIWVGITLATGFVLWRTAVILNFRAEGTGLIADAPELSKDYVVGSGHTLRMVILGDSTAVGIGATSIEKTMGYLVASHLGARVSVTNLAVSGATLRDVLEGQVEKIPPGVDWAMVSVTANDATHGTEPILVKQELERLVDDLRSRGVRRVLLSTTPSFRTTPAMPLLLNRLYERRAAGLTAVIRQTSADHPEVRLADLNREGTLTEDRYAADGFHPNNAGYAAWAEVFLRTARRP